MNLYYLVLLALLSNAKFDPNKKIEKKIAYPKEAIIQAIIDLEGLQPYLPTKVAGPVPLVISDQLIGRDLKLNKIGELVRIVPNNEVKGAYLRFTVFSCKEAYCNIAFEYPTEGVIGSAGIWIKQDGSLQIEKTHIRERKTGPN